MFQFFVSATMLLSAHAASAAESAYPTRPIRLIVPFVAGGGTDLLARLISHRLSDTLGQQIVVDNRGGAGSVIGTQLVAKAPPDGYTLGLMDTAFAINPALVNKLPYDAERDFVFVAIIATSPSLLVTHPGLKVRTIQELVAAAKQNPGKIKAASAGIGSSSHLSTEMLKSGAKIDLLHVPFKGAGAAILDILAGNTDTTFVVPGSLLQHIQAGTMIPLAITGKKPSPLLPSVPTFASVGLGGVNPEAFRFIVAPRGLPAAAHKKLASALGTIMQIKDLQTRLVDNGFDPEFLTDPEARAFVAKELRKWRQVVKDSGVKPN